MHSIEMLPTGFTFGHSSTTSQNLVLLYSLKFSALEKHLHKVCNFTLPYLPSSVKIVKLLMCVE